MNERKDIVGAQPDYFSEDFRLACDIALEQLDLTMADVNKSNLFDDFEKMLDKLKEFQAENPIIDLEASHVQSLENILFCHFSRQSGSKVDGKDSS